METSLTSLLSQPQASSLLGAASWALTILLVWSLIWKGIALWKSARLSHKWWFVILLIVNTAGILEIIYIFLVARKRVEKVETPIPPVSAL